MDVVSGEEVDLIWAQEASDEDLRLASYRQQGKDLLLETPYGPLPSTFEALVFGIQVRGYRILLAHPERNPAFRNDPRPARRSRKVGSAGSGECRCSGGGPERLAVAAAHPLAPSSGGCAT